MKKAFFILAMMALYCVGASAQIRWVVPGGQTLPNGCVSTEGYSTATGQKCDSLMTSAQQTTQIVTVTGTATVPVQVKKTITKPGGSRIVYSRDKCTGKCVAKRVRWGSKTIEVYETEDREVPVKVTVPVIQGPQGPMGPEGPPGPPGEGCVVSTVVGPDGANVHVVVCGSGNNQTTAQIRDGRDGKNGLGCTIRQLPDRKGKMRDAVVCEDGTSAVIPKGGGGGCGKLGWKCWVPAVAVGGIVYALTNGGGGGGHPGPGVITYP